MTYYYFTFFESTPRILLVNASIDVYATNYFSLFHKFIWRELIHDFCIHNSNCNAIISLLIQFPLSFVVSSTDIYSDIIFNCLIIIVLHFENSFLCNSQCARVVELECKMLFWNCIYFLCSHLIDSQIVSHLFVTLSFFLVPSCPLSH